MIDQFLGLIVFCPVCGSSVRACGFEKVKDPALLEIWQCTKCARKFGVVKA
jgi:hypothetical protein